MSAYHASWDVNLAHHFFFFLKGTTLGGGQWVTQRACALSKSMHLVGMYLEWKVALQEDLPRSTLGNGNAGWMR